MRNLLTNFKPLSQLPAIIEICASELPRITAQIMKALPHPIEKKALEHLINKALRESLDAGEFHFLKEQTVQLHVADVGWSITLTGTENGRISVIQTFNADTRISGTAQDLIYLAAGYIDPDTLFFQRRLCIEGNVALGLEVKNTLDGFNRTSIPRPLGDLLRIANYWFARKDKALHDNNQGLRQLSRPGLPCQ